MRDLLRSTRDHAAAWIERERPYFSLSALLMYAFALAAEVSVIAARFLLGLLVIGVVMLAESRSSLPASWLFLSLAPTVWSTSALLRPFGGSWWWRTRAGGRDPSQREQLAYQGAVELLQSYSPKLSASAPTGSPRGAFGGGCAHRRGGRADGIEITALKIEGVKGGPVPPDERSRNARARHTEGPTTHNDWRMR
jgi:hypothetical protein